MNTQEYEQIESKHIAYAQARGDDKTYCPSKVARDLYPNNWRDKMDAVRKVADDMFIKGELKVLQYGKEFNVLPSKMKGHIRLRRCKNLGK